VQTTHSQFKRTRPSLEEPLAPVKRCFAVRRFAVATGCSAHYSQVFRRPVLLIHGAKDPNPGTHPMQSERLFDALSGLGKVARLVILQHEGHVYRSSEGIAAAIGEMADWLHRFLEPDNRPVGARE